MKKMTKKQTQKNVSVKKSSPVKLELQNNMEENQSLPKKPLSFYLGLGIVLVLFLTLLYSFKSLFVVAIVNNQPITRLAVVSDLEKQAGKQVLSSLITKALIEQEAVKRKIIIDNKTIDEELKKVEARVKTQNQNLDQLLAVQNMTRANFKDQLKTQKIIEVMFQKETKVTAKEIKDYMEKNAETLAQNTNVTENDIKMELEQQKLQTAFQNWLEKAKKEAKISYFLNY